MFGNLTPKTDLVAGNLIKLMEYWDKRLGCTEPAGGWDLYRRKLLDYALTLVFYPPLFGSRAHLFARNPILPSPLSGLLIPALNSCKEKENWRSKATVLALDNQVLYSHLAMMNSHVAQGWQAQLPQLKLAIGNFFLALELILYHLDATSLVELSFVPRRWW